MRETMGSAAYTARLQIRRRWRSLIYDPSSLDPTYRVLQGRLPPASDSSAVLVNENYVKEFGLHAGDHLTVTTFAPKDLPAVMANHYDHPHGPRFWFRIAAVVRTPNDIVLDQVKALDPALSYGTTSDMLVPSSFYDANHSRFLGFGEAYNVTLAPGTSVAAFEAPARRARREHVSELLRAE